MIRQFMFAMVIPAGLAAQTSIKSQVDSLHGSMMAAFKSNPATVAAFYTDDAAIVGGGARVVGKEGVDRYWGQIPPGSTWKLEVLDVGGDDASPWVHGRSTFAPPGSQGFVTEYIGLLQRSTDGTLRFRVDGYARDIPSPTPAADEAAVRRVDSLWARMYATHDTASALQLYSDQLVFVSANGRHKTRAEELADVRPAAGLVMDFRRG